MVRKVKRLREHNYLKRVIKLAQELKDEGKLPPGDGEALGGCFVRCRRCLQCVGVSFDGAQRIGNILKRSLEGGAIERSRLIEGCFGSALLVKQSAGIENRLGRVAG